MSFHFLSLAPSKIPPEDLKSKLYREACSLSKVADGASSQVPLRPAPTGCFHSPAEVKPEGCPLPQTSGSTCVSNSPKPMSIESVMPSSHLILCHPLLLLPPIPPSIRVFSNESTLRMRWPKYWSSPRGEALFRCARPSGVPRGPATSTGSLASQRHPGKFPKVPGRRRGPRITAGTATLIRMLL